MDAKGIENIGKLSLSDLATKKAQALSSRGAAGDASERRKVAQEFTSFLYLEMLKAMRAAMPQSDIEQGESLSRDIYSSMMDAEVARVAARRDASGFAKVVERSLDRMGAAPSKPSEALPVVAPPAADLAPAIAPASGIISSSFGPRADPIHGRDQFHHGIDIAAPAGSAVKTVAAGRVSFSGVVPGYGNLVEIDHGGGWVTRYGHNAKNLVRGGDSIEAGRAIALVGRSGRATGDHLHFEVRRDGKAVDPTSFPGAPAKGSKFSSRV